MENTEKLIKKINDKLDKWDEKSTFTIDGISKITYSDLNLLLLYIKLYKMSNKTSFGDLDYPTGVINDILEKNDISIKSKSIIFN